MPKLDFNKIGAEEADIEVAREQAKIQHNAAQAGFKAGMALAKKQLAKNPSQVKEAIEAKLKRFKTHKAMFDAHRMAQRAAGEAKDAAANVLGAAAAKAKKNLEQQLKKEEAASENPFHKKDIIRHARTQKIVKAVSPLASRTAAAVKSDLVRRDASDEAVRAAAAKQAQKAATGVRKALAAKNHHKGAKAKAKKAKKVKKTKKAKKLKFHHQKFAGMHVAAKVDKAMAKASGKKKSHHAKLSAMAKKVKKAIHAAASHKKSVSLLSPERNFEESIQDRVQQAIANAGKKPAKPAQQHQASPVHSHKKQLKKKAQPAAGRKAKLFKEYLNEKRHIQAQAWKSVANKMKKAHFAAEAKAHKQKQRKVHEQHKPLKVRRKAHKRRVEHKSQRKQKELGRKELGATKAAVKAFLEGIGN